MVKIIPHNMDSSLPQMTLDMLDEDVSEVGHVPAKKRNIILRYLLSIRLILIITIILLVVFTAISIWATSYSMNEKVALDQVDQIINNMKNTISEFLYRQLMRPKYVADTMAQDYYNGYIDMNDSIKGYLFSRLKLFNVTLLNFCFGERGNDISYGFTTTYDNLSFFRKKQAENRMILYWTDPDTGKTSFDWITQNTSYVVSATGYYKESLQMLKNNPDGGFGQPYKPLGAAVATYWSTPIYNRTEYPGVKNRIGLSKINLSLEAISKYLSQVKVMSHGFIVLSEYDTNYLIGCSLSVDGIRFDRVNIFTIEERYAGKMLKQIVESNNTMKYVTTPDGTKYMVDTSTFEFYNIRWRMNIFISNTEITAGIVESSYIIIGVTVFVTICGIVLGVVIGWLITNPFFSLQRDLKMIEVLDFENIRPRKSIFSESKSIYNSLTETVRWLNEIKSFIPDSVLLQLENSHLRDNKKLKATIGRYSEQPVDSSISKETNSESIHTGSLTSKDSFMNEGGKNSIFKVGLSRSECAIIYLTLANLTEETYDYDPGFMATIISKALTSISNICRNCRGDLQIKSHNEFVVFFSNSEKNPAHTALETCLKIRSMFVPFNDHLAKEGRPALDVCMGVASGKTVNGNVGSKQTRYFALIGSVLERAKTLNEFSTFLNVPIVADTPCFIATKGRFVVRPIERIYNQDYKTIEEIYHVVKKNHAKDEEWQTDLEEKPTNLKFDEYSTKFTLLFSGTLTEHQYDTVSDYLQSVLKTNPKDQAILRLSRFLESYRDSDVLNFTNYHTSIEKNFKVSF